MDLTDSEVTLPKGLKLVHRMADKSGPAVSIFAGQLKKKGGIIWEMKNVIVHDGNNRGDQVIIDAKA